MSASQGRNTALLTHILGGLGVLGGLLGLAAFAGFPGELNSVRLTLWYMGAIAVALAAYGPHAAISRRLALAGTIPLVLASTWAVLWLLLGTGRESLSSGAFGLIGFWAELAGWLAAVPFGFVAARLGVLSRSASLALAIGSLLTVTGMDRLALTSPRFPTVFAALALAGFVIVATAWVLLGAQIAIGRVRHTGSNRDANVDGPRTAPPGPGVNSVSAGPTAEGMGR